MIRNFIRMVLWVALIGTTATFLMLAALLPSAGLVAGLIEFVTGLSLSVAGVILWAWGDAEETEKYRLEKLAAEARLRAGIYSPDTAAMLARFDAALKPGSCPEFQHLLKRLAASR
jgi:hypothetical protein